MLALETRSKGDEQDQRRVEFDSMNHIGGKHLITIFKNYHYETRNRCFIVKIVLIFE